MFHNFFRRSSCSIFLFLHNLFWVTSQENNPHFFFPLRLLFRWFCSSVCVLSVCLSACVSLSVSLCVHVFFFLSLSLPLWTLEAGTLSISLTVGAVCTLGYICFSWCSVLGLYTITALWLCWGSGVLLSLWAFFSFSRVLNFAVPKVFYAA